MLWTTERTDMRKGLYKRTGHIPYSCVSYIDLTDPATRLQLDVLCAVMVNKPGMLLRQRARDARDGAIIDTITIGGRRTTLTDTPAIWWKCKRLYVEEAKKAQRMASEQRERQRNMVKRPAGRMMHRERTNHVGKALAEMLTDPDDPRHGTSTGYSYGCRCERCRSAARDRRLARA